MTGRTPGVIAKNVGAPTYAEPARNDKVSSTDARFLNHTGKSPSATGSDTSPQAIAAAHIKCFLSALGHPQTIEAYDAAIARAVAAIAGQTKTQVPDYDRFNTLIAAMPADERATFYSSTFAATGVDDPAQAHSLAAGRFVSNVKSIQKLDTSIVAPRQRSAHPDGVSAVISVEMHGDVPAHFHAGKARVRLGPGSRGVVPGLSVAFMGLRGDTSRVFAGFGAKAYDATLSTKAFGITTTGRDGDLIFVPGPELCSLKLTQNGKASNAWIKQARAIPTGTRLGTIHPIKGDWSIDLTLTESQLTHNLFAERSTRFPRRLAGIHLLGSAALAVVRFVGAIWRFFRAAT